MKKSSYLLSLQLLLLSLIFIFISVYLFSNNAKAVTSEDKPTVKIGSKAFSESIILAEMISIVLEEKYGFKIERKFNLGGTSIAFRALENADIDLYPEYTGTGLVMILKHKSLRDPKKVYDIVRNEFAKKYKMTWSAPIGPNNTYALAIKSTNKKFLNISKVGQLRKLSERLSIAAPHEYLERPDGHKAFSKFYGLRFKNSNTIAMNSGLMYDAIKDDQVDLIVSYSTDGRIKAYNLKLLEDDKLFFPPYYVSYLAREEYLKTYPEIKDAFSLFKNLITDEEMMALNDLVDREKRSPYIIAKNFLIKKKLLQGNSTKLDNQVNFWSFLKSKQAYLLKVTKEHLLLSFFSLVLALIFSLPLGIVLTRSKKLAKLVFPIINTIQTIPSLALLGLLIPIFGIGYKPAIISLFLYSLLPLIRNIYSGIEGVDNSYIEASKGMGLTPLQVLTKVEIPLALPVILAGIRTATVIVIGTATLAALVGAGGLGDPIFRGVATVNGYLIFLGALPSALLAIIADRLWDFLEKKLVSPGIRNL